MLCCNKGGAGQHLKSLTLCSWPSQEVGVRWIMWQQIACLGKHGLQSAEANPFRTRKVDVWWIRRQ